MQTYSWKANVARVMLTLSNVGNGSGMETGAATRCFQSSATAVVVRVRTKFIGGRMGASCKRRREVTPKEWNRELEGYDRDVFEYLALRKGDVGVRWCDMTWKGWEWDRIGEKFFSQILSTSGEERFRWPIALIGAEVHPIEDTWSNHGM